MPSVTLTPLPPSVRCLMINSCDYLTEDEYHALKQSYAFLCDLIDPKKYPAIPAKIRKNASACLKHYPASKDWDKVYETVGFFNPE